MKKAVLHFLFLHQFSTCVFALYSPLHLTLRVILPKTMRAAYLRGSYFSPFAFYLCLSAKNAQIILVFFCGYFSSVCYASSPSAHDVHFCEVLDYEDIRTRDSLYAATKQAFNLDVGEPRTVRMIYFLPNDRPFQQGVVDRMKVTIREIQTFYADQMEAHGYGRKTFRFETDAQGDPVVHRVDGGHPNSYYVDGGGRWDDIPRKFDFQANNVYLTVWDKGTTSIRPGVAGSGGGGRDGGSATVSDRFRWTTVAHELGHTFGLGHDWRDGNYIMSYGAGGSGRHSLSACATEFLSAHPYFNPDIPDEGTPPPTIELISPNEYPTGSTSVSIQLQVSDPDGLHQVILFAEGGLKACRKLNGETNTVVQFDYDGVIPASNDPQGTGTSLSNPLVHNISVRAVDTDGNVASTGFGLVDDSTQRNVIATLEGDKSVNFLAFSPDGKTLSGGGVVWDIATRTEITTPYGSNEIVAFSPDGKTLATRGTVWDIATRTAIITLKSRNGIVAFSPDGKTLAEVSFRDGKGYVELWDIATRRNIATFEGHTRPITSVAFSSDGTTLASGGREGDGTVKLWDVATRHNIATIEVKNKIHGGVSSVAFSPDGSLLATGQRNEGSPGKVKLWDVATRRNIATFEHLYSVTSVAFSPDGMILASGSRDNTVKLWDVTRKYNVATFEHIWEVQSVAFSPDGTILASRQKKWERNGDGNDVTILLWDMSPYITPSTPTPVPTPDFDGDGIVGISDFLQFVDQFGFSRGDGGYDARFDLDGDGVIGVGDFLIFVDNFGKKVS